MSLSTIALTPHSNHVRYEALTAAGSAITAGMLVELVNGEYQENSTATTEAPRTFALEKISTAGDIDTPYSAGETCFVGGFPAGELVRALLANAEVVTEGSLLTSNGDGTLVTTGATAENAIAISKSATTASGVTRITIQLI